MPMIDDNRGMPCTVVGPYTLYICSRLRVRSGTIYLRSSLDIFVFANFVSLKLKIVLMLYLSICGFWCSRKVAVPRTLPYTFRRNQSRITQN